MTQSAQGWEGGARKGETANQKQNTKIESTMDTHFPVSQIQDLQDFASLASSNGEVLNFLVHLTYTKINAK